MLATHLTAGAHSSTRLVRDDADRLALLERLHAELGPFLAYCVMGTHVHLMVEGGPEPSRSRADEGLRVYTRAFNRRHGLKGTLRRGPVEPLVKRDAVELGRGIRYVHQNPLNTKPPLAAIEVDFEWSSARAYAGLARDRFVDVERARPLLASGRWLSLRRPPLAGLEPVDAPRVAPRTILGAAAAVFRVLVTDLASPRRSPELQAARAVYVTLGRLESYSDGQLAGLLGRSRRWTSELAADPDLGAVRMARTLFRDPVLRASLPTLPASEAASGASPRVRLAVERAPEALHER